MHDIETIKSEAKAILADRGINPNKPSAYEVWFRHFDAGDEAEILRHYAEHGDILPWLYDTAESYADPFFQGYDASGRRTANRLLKQFA
jgi:hypothetical protein